MITLRSSIAGPSAHELSPGQRADILIEALPYLRQFSGQTIVIKYGGRAMTNPELREQVCADVALLQYVGIRTVLVHGGGLDIEALLDQVGLTSTFVDGLRVTTDETMPFIEMALLRSNKGLAGMLNRHGARAIGLSGKDADLLLAKKLESATADLGWVGQVQQVNASLLTNLLTAGYLPVICSIAAGSDGETFNVNADTVAGLIAAAVGASKLVVLSDTPGLYLDPADPSSLVSEISVGSASALLDQGRTAGGMLPKLEACLAAVQSGVQAAHLIDGTVPHSLLVELLTDAGVGTMIVPDAAWRATANFPLMSLEVTQ